MTEKPVESFDVGIDFEHVLAAISKQIYDTPLAFLRENVQNAVDAIRIQAARIGIAPDNDALSVDVTIEDRKVRIRDNGIGMSPHDLRDLFWKIGASGKRNAEAKAAGCVGMFGIGGFANLGVCDRLTVISQAADGGTGTWTSLSQDEIRGAGTGLPQVSMRESDEAKPRGTIVEGTLRTPPNKEELRRYLREFVEFARERVTFNGVVQSRNAIVSPTERGALTASSETEEWGDTATSVRGQMFQDAGHALTAELHGLKLAGADHRLTGYIRFEGGGSLDVFKRGFKICTTKVQTQIGTRGSIDCDLLSPTAGRDSLDSESQGLISKILMHMEGAAIQKVLSSPELIAQHTRVFPYVLRCNLIAGLGNVVVNLADGSETTLANVERKATGGVAVYYGKTQMNALSHVMQTRGHVVVQLPGDRYKSQAVERFLTERCGAKAMSGMVEISEKYDNLTRFELVVLAELDRTIRDSYSVDDFRLVPAKLTEDIPVYLVEAKTSREMLIYVDTRHPELGKLETLGFSPLMYSLVAAFCTEYLGSTLRKRSPKFFGSGAINLASLEKRRSELWVLLSDDIQTLSRRSQRHVVRSSDVQTVTAGAHPTAVSTEAAAPPHKPKLLRIEGDEAFADIIGYYLRIPDGAVQAYGDVIRECGSRGSSWAGNKILFVASDAISTAFQFEIRMDHLILTSDVDGNVGVEGAAELGQPIQALNEGLYFPIPKALEGVLVPTGDKEIRIEVSSGDWIDLSSAHMASKGIVTRPAGPLSLGYRPAHWNDPDPAHGASLQLTCPSHRQRRARARQRTAAAAKAGAAPRHLRAISDFLPLSPDLSNKIESDAGLTRRLGTWRHVLGELGDRLARGDQAAFAELYDQCADRLHHYLIVRLESRPDADDVLQETFVRLARNRRKLARVESLAAYAFTVARNEAMRLLARRSRDARNRDTIHANELFCQAAGDAIERREAAELLAAALMRLPAEQREVIELKTYAHLTLGEIAAVTQSPPGTVATRYRSGLGKLREWLTEEYRDG